MKPLHLATHNIKATLPDDEAARAVSAVLKTHPMFAGWVEFGRSRRNVLEQFGPVYVFPRFRRLFRDQPDAGWVSVYPLGGQPITHDAEVAEFISSRSIQLSRARGRGRLEVRATYGTENLYRLRHNGETVPLLNVHPVAHHERPRNEAAWEEAAENIDAWSESWAGYRRYVFGDLNKTRAHVKGLHSCWDGNRLERTGPGNGTPDHIFGPNPFEQPEVIDTVSDHHAVGATEKE